MEPVQKRIRFEKDDLVLSDTDFRARLRALDTDGSYLRALSYLQSEEDKTPFSSRSLSLADWLGQPSEQNTSVGSYLAEARAGAAAERRLTRICVEHEHRLRDMIGRVTPSPTQNEAYRYFSYDSKQEKAVLEQNEDKKHSSYTQHAFSSSLDTTVKDEDSLSELSANGHEEDKPNHSPPQDSSDDEWDDALSMVRALPNSSLVAPRRTPPLSASF